MAVTKVISFRTEDGKEFDNIEDAEAHDVVVQLETWFINNVSRFVAPSLYSEECAKLARAFIQDWEIEERI